jgi:YVTN family beta-propeller protein
MDSLPLEIAAYIIAQTREEEATLATLLRCCKSYEKFFNNPKLWRKVIPSVIKLPTEEQTAVYLLNLVKHPKFVLIESIDFSHKSAQAHFWHTISSVKELWESVRQFCPELRNKFVISSPKNIQVVNLITDLGAFFYDVVQTDSGGYCISNSNTPGSVIVVDGIGKVLHTFPEENIPKGLGLFDQGIVYCGFQKPPHFKKYFVEGNYSVENVELATDLSVPCAMLSKVAEKQIWIVEYGSSTISKFDLNTGKVLASISGFGCARGIAEDKEKRLLYVADRDNNRLVLVDANTNEKIKSFEVGASPYCVKVASVGHLVVSRCVNHLEVYSSRGVFINKIPVKGTILGFDLCASGSIVMCDTSSKSLLLSRFP